MNNISKNIRRIFWLFLFLFLLAVGYLFNFIFFQSSEIVSNSYNKRLNKIDNKIIRGSILDSNEIVLAETMVNDDTSVRVYPFREEFAHIVGFIDKGKAGVEAKYTIQLQALHNEVIQRIANIMKGTELQGNSLVLTVDADLQKFVFEKLGEQKGAIIVLEPSTGKILASVSYPTFDPNSIQKNWDIVKGDNVNSPLINRATQGLYPPGSVYKIITAVSAMRNFPQYKDYTYECTGSENFDGNIMHCNNNKAHGIVNMEEAFAVSCNTYFASLGITLGASNITKTSNDLLFNSNYKMPLEYVKSTFELSNNASISEIIETSIGQGKTLVTPLHMALLVSAIANSGVMMEPYIVDHIRTPKGKEINKNMPKMLARVFSIEEANYLTELMKQVVEKGTATQIKADGYTFAGKTGTAENDKGLSHGWFVGFSSAENPKVVVSILLENIGGSSKTLPIAKDILMYAVEKQKNYDTVQN